jgi:hypothetical protein
MLPDGNDYQASVVAPPVGGVRCHVIATARERRSFFIFPAADPGQTEK